MGVIRHTKMAPASIQRQRQHKFYSIQVMKDGDVAPGTATAGISPVRDFDPDTEQDLILEIEVPRDWIAGTDMWIYPVFCSNQNWLGDVRWGIEYLVMAEGISIAAAVDVREVSIPMNGTGVVIPNKEYWMTILRSDLQAITNEAIFQQDNFTKLVCIQLKIYRAAASALDTHGGNARLLGIVHVYDAFI